MNRTKLKNYAPQARRDFIAAVTDRAAYFGLTKQHIEPITEQGDVALISGKPFPRDVAAKRRRLEGRISQHGFEQVMEAMAYTWFNRLVAIRYMELHGYLEHGYRVLSHPERKPIPEILEHAEHIDLPGLDTQKVIELKLDGAREAELYRMLLLVQCNALHRAMPFLFERIDDETELLLPDHLLHSDSLIRKLVASIDEEDWQEVEIIGWLYQFYISEKKDQVIGKVVKSEDIPAATQLFTPNWIVKYLVQNSLGRQWLATYPNSPLRQQMTYYIEPAEQTPEVQAQLKAITPESLNPEEITLLDPACGSGHILVEAYDLFKAIYQERGYRARDIPSLILQKNLYGLEIDDRAAQLAAFALMMKARADDRRLFDSEAKPNILALQDSRGVDAADITHALNAPINKEDVPSEYLFEEIEEEKAGLFSKKALAEKGHVSQGDIASLLALFENAKTFGSLIQIPPNLAAKLPEIEKRLDDVLKHGDLTHASAQVLKPLLQQARLLAQQYDAVVANPPYMGTKGQNAELATFAKHHYPNSRSDLSAMFIERSMALAYQRGHLALITMHSWMFLSSLREMRTQVLSATTVITMAHLGPRAFDSISGEVVSTTGFVCTASNLQGHRGRYLQLTQGQCEEEKESLLRMMAAPGASGIFEISTQELLLIPGHPIAYWVSPSVLRLFAEEKCIGDVVKPRQGMSTNDNARFLRYWFEVPYSKIGFQCKSSDEALASGRKWFPYNKGGQLRKWYGNYEYVVNWQDDGREIKKWLVNNPKDPKTTHWSRRIINTDFYFQEGITWADITTDSFAARHAAVGSLFDVKGSSAFPSTNMLYPLLGLMNSTLMTMFMQILNPTVTFQVGDIARVPYVAPLEKPSVVSERIKRLVELARTDWNASELSWEFEQHPLIPVRRAKASLRASYSRLRREWNDATLELKRLEEDNNRAFLVAYRLAGEVSPDVSASDIALNDDPVHRYGARSDDQECEVALLRDTTRDLLSYAIGCMMGRYSLGPPGLIYAHSGNDRFWDLYHEKHERHEKNKTGIFSYDSCLSWSTFPPDPDGIVPLMESDWFADDAANRFIEFISVAEQGGGALIPAGPLNPGVLHTVAHGSSGHLGLYRLETQVTAGNGAVRMSGLGSNSAAREAIKVGFDYFKANTSQVSASAKPGDHDFHLHVVEFHNAGPTTAMTLAAFVALCSGLLGKPLQSQLVILGSMSLGGSIIPVQNLAESLQVAFDAGAKRLLLPMASVSDIPTIPGELFAKFQTGFYADPRDAVFKALGVE